MKHVFLSRVAFISLQGLTKKSFFVPVTLFPNLSQMNLGMGILEQLVRLALDVMGASLKLPLFQPVQISLGQGKSFGTGTRLLLIVLESSLYNV